MLTGNEPGKAEGLCGLDFHADFVVFWEEVVALLLFLEEEDMVRVVGLLKLCLIVLFWCFWVAGVVVVGRCWCEANLVLLAIRFWGLKGAALCAVLKPRKKGEIDRE